MSERDPRDLVLREDHAAGAVLAPYPPLMPPMPAPLPEEQDPKVFRAMVRHWWLIVLFALIGAGAAVLYLRHAQPLYTSYALLYIAPSRGPLAETLGTVQRANFLNTQVEVMRSTPILRKATADLPHLRTFKGAPPADWLREKLIAEVGRKDDIITIAVDSPYPDEAAVIVNAVVAAYAEASTQQRETESTRMLRALEQKKAENDAEVRAIEDAMRTYKQNNPTLTYDAVISGRLAQISNALVAAQIASVDVRTKFGPGHNAVRSAQEAEDKLYTMYEEEKKQHMEHHSKSAEYARFHSDLVQKQEFSLRLLDRIRQLELAASQAPLVGQIEIIEPPRVAESPSWPRKYRTLAVALAAGVMLGAGLALLRERLDNRMRSIEEIQTIIGLPVLGVVPQMSGRRTAVARAMTVHLDPRSVVAEAYRSVRTAIYFGAADNRCKTILITSPEPGDGKTTSASNLAIAIAQTGRSVLLLDADFRKPTQHKNLDIKEAVGLSSVLARREPISRAIQHTGVDGLDILPCGPIPANPSEILNSREFGELVDHLALKYDHILFDSPPVNAVTDARILGAVCDATILVLRADKSTRTSGEHARNALLSVGARVLGVVVNDAPRRKGYEVYGGSYYGQTDVTVRANFYDDSKMARGNEDEPTDNADDRPARDASRRRSRRDRRQDNG